MGHPTVCDGGGCLAEHANPISQGHAVLPRMKPGWGTLHASDEATGFSYSYDLCAACIGKIVELIGLKTGEEMARERNTSFRAMLSEQVDLPIAPPNKCGTCGEPYVGETCYFCPPPSVPLSLTEDPR